MSDKLTGREAVIALMQGKKVKDNYVTFSLGYDDKEVLDDVGKNYGFRYFLAKDEFYLVPEQMVWEGEGVAEVLKNQLFENGVLSPMGTVAIIRATNFPLDGDGKRVKVRVEEIL